MLCSKTNWTNCPPNQEQLIFFPIEKVSSLLKALCETLIQQQKAHLCMATGGGTGGLCLHLSRQQNMGLVKDYHHILPLILLIDSKPFYCIQI